MVHPRSDVAGAKITFGVCLNAQQIYLVIVLTGLWGIKRLVQLLLVQVICGTVYPGLGILPDAIEAGWYKGALYIGAASYL